MHVCNLFTQKHSYLLLQGSTGYIPGAVESPHGTVEAQRQGPNAVRRVLQSPVLARTPGEPEPRSRGVAGVAGIERARECGLRR